MGELPCDLGQRFCRQVCSGLPAPRSLANAEDPGRTSLGARLIWGEVAGVYLLFRCKDTHPPPEFRGESLQGRIFQVN